MNTQADPHASRRLEVAQLALAIEKTTRAYAAALDQVAALGSRLARQEAELRFQRLVLRIPYAPRHQAKEATE